MPSLPRPALVALFLLALAGCRPGSRLASHRTIHDIEGKPREVPAQVRRVACLDVLCYSSMIVLGEADKVISIQVNAARAPWVDRVRPPKGIVQLVSTPTLETLLSQRPDVVFGGYGGGKESEAMARAGLVQVRAQPFGKKAATAAEFVADQQRMVRVFAETMGPEAKVRAEAWCGWFDSTVRFVRSRTDTIPKERRPRAYYVRGPSPLTTHGPGSYVTWYGEMAGADMVVERMGFGKQGGAGSVVMEDLLRWDPEVVFMGRLQPASLVRDDSRWKGIAAVQSGRILEMPAGVFFWDGGTECGLLLLWMAKHLHPGLFADVDLRAEVQRYYRRFYRTELTPAEADLLLAGKDPHGKRSNPWGI